MPKDLERQRRFAHCLKDAEERVGWLADRPLADKLYGRLGHVFDHPSRP